MHKTYDVDPLILERPRAITLRGWEVPMVNTTLISIRHSHILWDSYSSTQKTKLIAAS